MRLFEAFLNGGYLNINQSFFLETDQVVVIRRMISIFPTLCTDLYNNCDYTIY